MKKRSPSSRTSPPGQRQLRVAERIRHILSDVMREERLHDPVLAKSSMISISAVDIGPDLQHATAYIMPLGGKDADLVVEALNRASGFFRAEMAQELELRYTPKVSFRLDRSFDEAEHISRLLHQEHVRKDIERTDDEEE